MVASSRTNHGAYALFALLIFMTTSCVIGAEQIVFDAMTTSQEGGRIDENDVLIEESNPASTGKDEEIVFSVEGVDNGLPPMPLITGVGSDEEGESSEPLEPVSEDQKMVNRAIEILRTLDQNSRSGRSDVGASLDESLTPNMFTVFARLLRSVVINIIDFLIPVSYEDQEAFLEHTQTDGTPNSYSLSDEGPSTATEEQPQSSQTESEEIPPVQVTDTPYDGMSRKERLQEAMNLLKSAAEYNNTDALYLLGEMHFYGNYSTPRAYSKATEYYHKLSEVSGNATAQNMLGFMYSTGIFGDVPRDQAKALLYHTFAAYGGDTRSEMTLAYRYHAGIGTPRNCEKAVFFYKRVADKVMAYWRSGPPGGRTLDQHTWKLADDHGGVYGEGASHSSVGNPRKRYSPASDSASLDDVLEYLRYIADKSDIAAQYSLARFYYEGTRVLKRNYAEAMKYFKLVAKQCWTKDGKLLPNISKVAELYAGRIAGYLGRMYLRGEGVPVDAAKALKWYKLGAKAGDAASLNGLGYMHLKGLGGLKANAVKAAEYFRAAAERDFGPAQVNIGKLFLEKQEVAIATQYFEHAVRHRHIEAYYYLAEMYNQGLDKEPSCGMAAVHYKIVAEKVEDIHSPLAWAHERYKAADYENALIGFMMAAEQGYESAQANVAYLIDRDKSAFSLSTVVDYLLGYFETHTDEEIAEDERIEKLDRFIDEVALIYWTRASKQTNVDATVKMGDYYLKGIGTQKDNEKAAACYQSAAEFQQSALALWNLGWMHENGLGVEQDFHLAKRFYDLALTTNSEAYLPVTLALYRLRLRSFWNSFTGGSVNGIGVDGGEEDDEKEDGKDGDDEAESWKAREQAGEQAGEESAPKRSFWDLLKQWWDQMNDDEYFDDFVPEDEADSGDGPGEGGGNYQI
ncbi:hypothetical protein BZA70DRAFT_166917 [Myxozyma melibiosi]|uniref:HCP-like protein n=1 Tax=Myxozyma melibiosi TaxID=54550 RepID=A0ABR1F556_9ASCO